MISNMKDCKIRIDVSRGSFKTVATAARSEKKVEWIVPDTDADADTDPGGFGVTGIVNNLADSAPLGAGVCVAAADPSPGT